MIHSHVSKLLKLENNTYLKNVRGRRKLFDATGIQVRSLKILGYRFGPLLIPITTSKIPDDLNLIICRKFDSAEIAGT